MGNPNGNLITDTIFNHPSVLEPVPKGHTEPSISIQEHLYNQEFHYTR